MARTAAALEDIYALFRSPPPRAIEGCPCCIDTRKTDVLIAKPLRSLTGRDLWRYVSGVFLTVGSVRDFRYLLPRILEVAIEAPRELPDVEIVLGKLRLAGWEAWTAKERTAIEALIAGWFDEALARDIAESEDWLVGSDADAVLCGAARADLDLSAYIARLGAPAAAPVRTYLANRYAKAIDRGSAPNGFWEDAPDGWRQLAVALSTNES